MTSSAQNVGLRPKRYFYILAGTMLVLDQLTKYWIDSHMFLGNSRAVISGLFSLTYVANDGIAFGLFQGRNVLMGLCASAILAVAILYARTLDWRKAEVNVIGALIFGGAVGNIIDRFRKGYVIDFFDFHWHGHHWPAFNVADACISVSVVYIILRLWFQSPSRGVDATKTRD